MPSRGAHELDCVRPLRTLDVPGFVLCEAVYCDAQEIPAQRHEWAMLCLTLDGSYRVDWGHSRVRCGPSALVFHAPGEVYGAQISEEGSRCLTVRIDPLLFVSAAEVLPDVQRLQGARRAPPRWLAFQLRRELELSDDLTATAVESAIIALLAEINEIPGLEAPTRSPPWLARVQEQIDDEFRLHHTLATLALTAGVHRVHLAREFRRRFGCTIGHYIRQRRIEFACYRLTVSQDPLSHIAFDSGFADQSHFTNMFHKLVGITPGDFRARFGTHAPSSITRS